MNLNKGFRFHPNKEMFPKKTLDSTRSSVIVICWDCFSVWWPHEPVPKLLTGYELPCKTSHKRRPPVATRLQVQDLLCERLDILCLNNSEDVSLFYSDVNRYGLIRNFQISFWTHRPTGKQNRHTGYLIEQYDYRMYKAASRMIQTEVNYT
jgi:hypothetical protein